MVRVRIALVAGVCGVAALALAGCDNGPSAVARHQAAGTQMAAADDTSGGSGASASDRSDDRGGDRVDHRRDAVKMVDGAPMWSASRKYSAQENAERAFDRNGKAFGADDLGAFVKKAHAFVDHPPKGTLTLTRANGDKLFYDPKGNVFAVASKDGAPRTMFKPDDGMSYWQQQKDREAKRQTASRDRKRSRSGDDA
jgi:pyocin large subunit-like protein